MTEHATAFEPDDPYAMTIEQARAALELVAFRSLDVFERVVEGSG